MSLPSNNLELRKDCIRYSLSSRSLRLVSSRLVVARRTQEFVVWFANEPYVSLLLFLLCKRR